MKREKAWYRATKDTLRQRDGDDCWICDQHMPVGTETIDHWQPVSCGGSDEIENLRLAHHDCNRRRGNIPPEMARSVELVRPFPAIRRAMIRDYLREQTANCENQSEN